MKEVYKPGNWIRVLRHHDTRLIMKEYEISTFESHRDDLINVLGAPMPNSNGGYNVLIKDIELVNKEPIINNSYDIY